MSLRIGFPALLAAGVVLMLTACTGGKETHSISVGDMGDPVHGKQLLDAYGCGGCHTIPGVHAARGKVGPPLYFWSERTMIAGELPNTPQNLTRWIMHPQSVEPKTAMPDLGVSPRDANDMAAYLYKLRGREGNSWND